MIEVKKGAHGLKRGKYEMEQDGSKVLFKRGKRVISIPIELLKDIKLRSYEDNYAM